MQNRFIGDIGDFGKYGLLRCLCKSGLRMGINWYLTDDGIDSAGNLTDYLLTAYKGYVECDQELYEKLHNIVYVENVRTVDKIEKSGLFPKGTEFYSRLLKSDKHYREKWFEESLKQLSHSDLIFLDPDNNILMNEIGYNYRKDGSLYAFPSEIANYYFRGHSLIIYNHANRQPVVDYFRRFDFIKTNPIFKDARVLVMKYNRQQVRYYLFVLKPEDVKLIEDCLDNMIASPWGRKWKWDKPHFEKLALM